MVDINTRTNDTSDTTPTLIRVLFHGITPINQTVESNKEERVCPGNLWSLWLCHVTRFQTHGHSAWSESRGVLSGSPTRKTKKSWGRSICHGRVCRPPQFAWSPKPVTVPNTRILSTISEAHLTIRYRVMTFSLSIRYVTL